MDIKNRIVDFHGRVENIALYNYDPTTPRGADNKKDMNKKNNAIKFLIESSQNCITAVAEAELPYFVK